MNYIWTDNPEDPCSLCVIWVGEEFEDMIPHMPSGPVNRVYRGQHKECMDAVLAYMTDREHDL